MRNPHNEPLTDQEAGKSGAAGDAVPGRDSRAPERRCILTGVIAPRDALLRLALGPEDAGGAAQIFPDVLARAPGRGAWIGVSSDELREAQEKGRLKSALARAFRTGNIVIPADLPELIENALCRALLDRLGLELRAGKLILGSDRIGRAAREGKIAALYHASDAKEDGSRKLDQALRVGWAHFDDEEGVANLKGERLPLDRGTLSVALGRENVVHLALADQLSAERVALPLRRLKSFTMPVQADAMNG